MKWSQWFWEVLWGRQHQSQQGVWIQTSRPAAIDLGFDADERKLSQETKTRDSSDDNSSPKNEGDGAGQNDDQEQQSQGPQPVGFWDPRLAGVRTEAFFKWSVTTSVLFVFIIAVLSLFWGALSSIDQNTAALKVYVVDFDGRVAPYDNIDPVVGPIVTQMTAAARQNRVSLGYQIRQPAEFNNDPIQVRQAVYDFDAWAALIVNPNATALLVSAVQNANTSYDPNGAMQLVYTDSRDDTNWYDFISPLIRPFLTQVTASVGTQWAQQVLQNATSNDTLASNLQQVPQAVSPAVGFSEYNLRPFYPYTAIPAISVGLIYLIIISFFSFAFYLPIHFKYLKPEGHPPLHFWQLTLWRWCSTMLAYFILSLAYSLVSLAFNINFHGGNPIQSETLPTIESYGNPTAFGYGTFPMFWLLNWVGMMALGLACENVAMVVGQPWSALWLIFWVISNVTTAFYDIEIEPGFYHWGYAWPLHSIVEASRMILFDLHPTLGKDFGILIAWAIVNSAVFPFACYFMRWKSKHHIHEYYR
ncbi:uncharacterized protein LTR77_008975 [Saxophila tyrrhenica]|uniref:DUF3533 domain-containing protein n=1 Tax=Saxophila tyrrhenica TaxID=1690608 RepID=A0AAV9NZ65_9PEZI|nr:hypothetical protein LTR77_008975 [Saxophila tyrrhenica]